MLEKPPLPTWMDYEKARQISQYRGLGFSQEDIAVRLGLSQQTVSRYLSGLREQAERSDNTDQFFLGLIIGGITAALLIGLLSSRSG